MSAKYLIVDPQLLVDDACCVSGDDFHHLHRVMRRGVGATVCLADGAGRVRVGEISAVHKHSLQVAFSTDERVPPPLSVDVTLIYGLAKNIRTEWVLQKVTELGVSRIVPAICERSVVRPKDMERKQLRLQEVVRQAARQSGRAYLPEVAEAIRLSDALARTDNASVKWVFAPGGDSLKETQTQLTKSSRLWTVAVGPEGGFSDSELSLFSSSGFNAVAAGPLTLRSETAAIVAVSMALLAGGAWDSV